MRVSAERLILFFRFCRGASLLPFPEPPDAYQDHRAAVGFSHLEINVISFGRLRSAALVGCGVAAVGNEDAGCAIGARMHVRGQ